MGQFRCLLSGTPAIAHRETRYQDELSFIHDLNKGGDADLLAVTAGLVLCVHESVRGGAGLQQGLAGRNADRGTAFLLSIALAH